MITAESQTAKLGLWLFLAADSMFFLGLIGAYIVLRSGQTKTIAPDMPTGTLFGTMAALIIGSGATMTTATVVYTAKRKIELGLIATLALTLFTATGFLFVTATHLQVPSLPMQALHACYFTFWAVHALHVIAGMIAILILLVQAIRGKFLPAQTRLVGIYWQFVVWLWILLFPILLFSGI